MRRIVMAVMGTVSGLVLLFSYHTSTSSRVAATAQPAAVTGGSAAPAPAPASGSSGTFTGDAVSTRWGPVQVQITVQDGKITVAQAVEYPQSNGRDQQINSYAVPTLNQEVVTAQSARIDAVSGATVTSDGYTSSLQSAIDQAHL